ncbi:MAG: LEA type 2 family protein [Cyclobacteriaceae bacterium]|nr:LEA type 2 family protein [Cyclobacteriaceae bacterium]
MSKRFFKDRTSSLFSGIALTLFSVMIILSGTSCGPKEDIQFRHIRDVVVDGSGKPKLKAKAVFYNPNELRMKLRGLTVDIFVDGKKAAEIDQDLKTEIPARSEFTVPLEVTLATEDLNILDTVLGMLGGRKMEVHYKGALKLNYRGMPLRVPVNYKDEVRIRL